MKGLKVAFYTEAGSKRGMGHLVRLYTIYQEFIKNKANCLFFLDSDIDYSYKYSNIIYFLWDSFCVDEKYDIIFIDSYEADIDIYQKVVSVATGVFLDDFARLKYPSKGIVINFAPDSKKLFYSNINKSDRYLLGVDYLPLRKEITDFLYTKKKKQLFIMLGGSDVKNLSLQIIRNLATVKIKKTIVVNDKNIVKKLENYQDVKILFKPDDNELITAMAESSLAISTASMSVYELAYLKTPAILLAVAKNQEKGLKQFLNHKLALSYVNINSKNWIEKLKQEVVTSLNNKILIELKITKNGTKNIVKEVLRLCKKY